MTTEQAPQAIPVPASFPVKWDTPEEAARFWTADLMHWPNGLSTLSATMDMPAFVRGLLEDHLARRKDNRKLLWTLLMFQLWRERWLSGAAS